MTQENIDELKLVGATLIAVAELYEDKETTEEKLRNLVQKLAFKAIHVVTTAPLRTERN